MSYNPTTIRPKPSWVSVLAKPRQTTLASGLHLPGIETGIEKVTESEGTIVRVGISEKTKKMGLEPGQRICYRGFLKYPNPIETDETWPDGQKKDYFFMSVDDIMGVLAPGVEVGIFSAPNVQTKG